jgi:hypothetical protein
MKSETDFNQIIIKNIKVANDLVKYDIEHYLNFRDEILSGINRDNLLECIRLKLKFGKSEKTEEIKKINSDSEITEGSFFKLIEIKNHENQEIFKKIFKKIFSYFNFKEILQFRLIYKFFNVIIEGILLKVYY